MSFKGPCRLEGFTPPPPPLQRFSDEQRLCLYTELALRPPQTSEDVFGCWKKGGTSRRQPLPSWTPPAPLSGTFPPSHVTSHVSLLFVLYRNLRLSRPEALMGPKLFLEGAFSVFPPPITFRTPHAMSSRLSRKLSEWFPRQWIPNPQFWYLLLSLRFPELLSYWSSSRRVWHADDIRKSKTSPPPPQKKEKKKKKYIYIYI